MLPPPPPPPHTPPALPSCAHRQITPPVPPTHQHVLGQPALLLGQGGGDPEGKALLPQQGVAAVAAAEGLDLVPLGEVGDGDVVGVAGPEVVVFLPRLERLSNGVDAPWEGEGRGRLVLAHPQV